MDSITAHKIKSTVKSIMPEARVLLFGSQARGEAKPQSDYDILVITNKTIPVNEKITWITKIHKALVYTLDAPIDLLLQSEEEVYRKKNLPGHVLRWAMEEGVEL